MVGRQKIGKEMLKAGDLARREDRWVRGVKSGNPDEIGGYHMYAVSFHSDDTPQPLYNTTVGIQVNFRDSYPICVITRVKCIVK